MRTVCLFISVIAAAFLRNKFLLGPCAEKQGQYAREDIYWRSCIYMRLLTVGSRSGGSFLVSLRDESDAVSSRHRQLLRQPAVVDSEPSSLSSRASDRLGAADASRLLPHGRHPSPPRTLTAAAGRRPPFSRRSRLRRLRTDGYTPLQRHRK